MTLRTTAIGALLGLDTQMYSNALRKLPYMRHEDDGYLVDVPVLRCLWTFWRYLFVKWFSRAFSMRSSDDVISIIKALNIAFKYRQPF